MPDNLGILLRLMAGSLRQSNLPICQLVATALDVSVGQISRANEAFDCEWVIFVHHTNTFKIK